ncbi:MAG: hypothetical protein ACJAT7_001507 [Psychromonas sp.]|jgi:hypothetical protein
MGIACVRRGLYRLFVQVISNIKPHISAVRGRYRELLKSSLLAGFDLA